MLVRSSARNQQLKTRQGFGACGATTPLPLRQSQAVENRGVAAVMLETSARDDDAEYRDRLRCCNRRRPNRRWLQDLDAIAPGTMASSSSADLSDARLLAQDPDLDQLWKQDLLLALDTIREHIEDLVGLFQEFVGEVEVAVL